MAMVSLDCDKINFEPKYFFSNSQNTRCQYFLFYIDQNLNVQYSHCSPKGTQEINGLNCLKAGQRGLNSLQLSDRNINSCYLTTIHIKCVGTFLLI